MRIIGLKNLYMAVLTADDGTAKPTWETPERIPSLISFDIQDNTDNVTFYSDDQIEQVLPAFAGKEVTIELGYLSNKLEATITGNAFDAESGFFSQSGSAQAPEVALMFQAPKSKGGHSQFVVLYKGVLAKNDSSYKGKEDSVESSNITLTGVFMPLSYNGDVSAKIDSEDCKKPALLTNWFTQPTLKEDITSSSFTAKASK